MKNKKFTKDDLKVGYVVKFRRGDLRMVMPSASGHLLVAGVDGSNGDIPHYNDDLIHSYGAEHPSMFKQLDIMEVYGLSRWDFKALEISTEGRELLWKREPEKTCDDCAHKVVCPHVGMCEHFMAKAE
jgi:hypothetical protein